MNIYTASWIFTGESWLTDHAIVVNNGIIESVIPVSKANSSQKAENFPGCWLVPAFIDLQIYGADGKLLAVYPEADSLFSLKAHCEKGGTAFCLPTVATNTKDVFYKCIDAVKKYRESGGAGVLGLHLEGPWINPLKRGAHIESLIHPPTLKETKELLEYGKDIIKMITLAPEVCSRKVIDLILSYNVIISAGHSNATYAEAKNSFANGVTAVTHLFNAMSSLHHREPGLAGAVMDDDKVMASIIPDGYHIDHAAIRIAKKAMGERLFAITDAVTDTGKGYYQHQQAGDKYEAAGILSGSALTMNKALKNLVRQTGVEKGEALRMCSLYPARVINMEHKLGRIKEGYFAAIAVINEEFEVISMINS